MELDSFLSSPRWDILRIIIEEPSSPIEIAKRMGMTTSFISQQLKLLEAAGLVKKKRTGAVEKGKPRSVFSIVEESMYLVPLAKGFSQKKLLPLSKEQRFVLLTWNINGESLQRELQVFFWSINHLLEPITAIIFQRKNSSHTLFVVSSDTSLTQKINGIQKNHQNTVPFQVIASATSLVKRDNGRLSVLYGPQDILEEASLKGGKNG